MPQHTFASFVMAGRILLLTVASLWVTGGVAHPDIRFREARRAPLTEAGNAWGEYSVAAADFDGDGHLDLAATHKAPGPLGGFVAVMRGLGNGSFVQAQQYAVPPIPNNTGTVTYARGIATGDFNEDGAIDILVDSAELRQILFYRNRGDGTFDPPGATAAVHKPTGGIQVADLNGDGHLDAVTPNAEDHTVSVFRGNGNGTFQAPTQHAVEFNPNDVAIADFNGGGLDLAMSCGSGCVKVLLNDGSGGFPASATNVNTGNKDVRGLWAGDFNADGQQDIVGVGAGGSAGSQGFGFGIVLLRGNGNGTFNVPGLSDFLDTGGFHRGIGPNIVRDLDGDGRGDLPHFPYSDHRGGENLVIVAFGGASGFTPLSWVAMPQILGLRTSANVDLELADGVTVSASTAGDVNGDGVLDLVVAAQQGNNAGPGGVSMLFGEAGRRYAAPATSALGGPSNAGNFGATVGDFTGDGKVDVVAFWGVHGAGCPVGVVPGRGDGTFGPPTPPSFLPTGLFDGCHHSSVQAGDVDGDGKLDLAFFIAGDRWFLHYGFGNGTFENRGHQGPSGFEGRGLLLKDVNGDGRPDLVMSRSNARIEVMLTSASAAPQSSASIDLSAFHSQISRGIAAADFDRDGKIDLLAHVPISNAGRLLFLRGNGNGTFAPAQDVGPLTPGGDQPVQNIAVGDLNLDGRLDIAAAGSAHIFALVGNGNGTFQPPTALSAGFPIHQVSIVDLDDDHRPDILASGAGPGFMVFSASTSGGFSERRPVAIGNRNVRSLDVVDLDGDLHPDVVLVTDRGSDLTNIVSVLNESQLYTLLPDRGGDTGRVTLTVRGQNLQAGATVKLRRPGSPDIVGTNVVHSPAGGLTATFDLTNQPRGGWDLVITNPDGSVVELAAAFTIEEGKLARLWVDITGRLRVRPNGVETYYLTYGNTGNADLPASLIRITLPKDIGVISPREMAIRPLSSDSQHAEDENVASFFVPRVPPGVTQSVPIILKIRSLAPSHFDLIGDVKASSLFDDMLNLEHDPSVVATARLISVSDTHLDFAIDVNSSTDSGSMMNQFTKTPSPIETPLVTSWEETAARLVVRASVSRRASPPSTYSYTMDTTPGLYNRLRRDPNFTHAQQLYKFRVALTNCLADDGKITPTARGELLTAAKQALNAEIAARKLNGLVFDETSGHFERLRRKITEFETITQEQLSQWDNLIDIHYEQPDGEEFDIAAPIQECAKELDFLSTVNKIRVDVVAAFDPNEKVGPTGEGAARYITAGQPLKYGVYFENLAAATAPAQTVIVTDQLDPVSMDLTTLSLGPMSFGSSVLVTPPAGLQSYTETVDLRPANNLLVRIEASLNPSTAVLTWRFTSLDPITGLPTTDPDAGFLPPNVSAPQGQGGVFFTVASRSGLPDGTIIGNHASIVFDTNAPIVTNTWTNTIDNTPPTSTVTALSATQATTSFPVQWSGSDTTSGVERYAIYVSENAGPFYVWLPSTTSTQVTFTGDVGKTYAFYSVAEDGAANAELEPSGADTTTTVSAAADPTDQDADGLLDSWEQRFGLDSTTAVGLDGRYGDPDFDGLTNEQEQAAGSHPTGAFRRYLAEGATSVFFDTTIALANPGTETAVVSARFSKTDGSIVTNELTLAPRSRGTIHPNDLPGLEAAEFSTAIEANREIVVDRTMRWDARGYGSHAEASILAPSLIWYLAEGATHSGFELFYLLQNATSTAANVEVRYLLSAPAAPEVRSYTVAPHSRFNIWVDQDPALSNTDVSAVVTSTNGVPIIVERAMYLNASGETFNAGHESAAVPAPAQSWFLAEGATGSYFDLFLLIANPNDTDAVVEAKYLLVDGSVITKSYSVSGNSRFNIWVDLEDPRLADAALSTTVRSTNGVPIIVERAMWWPGSAVTWQEAHNSSGAIGTGTKWGVADGEVGGAFGVETYLLVANSSSYAGSVKVTLLFEDGTTAERTYSLQPTSRFNIAVANEFPEAANRRFGAVIESLGETPPEIVVERAMYSNASGVIWAAGGNALATRLP